MSTSVAHTPDLGLAGNDVTVYLDSSFPDRLPRKG